MSAATHLSDRVRVRMRTAAMRARRTRTGSQMAAQQSRLWVLRRRVVRREGCDTEHLEQVKVPQHTLSSPDSGSHHLLPPPPIPAYLPSAQKQI